MSDNMTNTARITPESYRAVYGTIGAEIEQFYAGGRCFTLYKWTRGEGENGVYVEWAIEGDHDGDEPRDSGALHGVFDDVEAARAAVHLDVQEAGGR